MYGINIGEIDKSSQSVIFIRDEVNEDLPQSFAETPRVLQEAQLILCTHLDEYSKEIAQTSNNAPELLKIDRGTDYQNKTRYNRLYKCLNSLKKYTNNLCTRTCNKLKYIKKHDPFLFFQMFTFVFAATIFPKTVITLNYYNYISEKTRKSLLIFSAFSIISSCIAILTHIIYDYVRIIKVLIVSRIS